MESETVRTLVYFVISVLIVVALIAIFLAIAGPKVIIG